MVNIAVCCIGTAAKRQKMTYSTEVCIDALVKRKVCMIRIRQMHDVAYFLIVARLTKLILTSHTAHTCS